MVGSAEDLSFLPLLEFGWPQPESRNVPVVQPGELRESNARKAIEVFWRNHRFRQLSELCLGWSNLFTHGMAHDFGDLAAILEAEGIGLRKRVACGLVSAYRAWHRLLLTETIGTFIILMHYVEAGGLVAPVNGTVLASSLLSLVPLLVLLAALCADEWVARGARPLCAYSVCLLTAACRGATIQSAQEAWLRAHLLSHSPGFVLHTWSTLAFDVIDILTAGFVVMFVFHARRSVVRILDRLRTAELTRVRLERSLINSHLESAQAQVDSASMLTFLEEIGRLYHTAPQDAEAKLDRFVETLQSRRTALRM